MKRAIKIALGLIFAILVVLFYVDAYHEDQKLQAKVKADFEKRYPTYELLSSVVGEGNIEVVEVHIEFKKDAGDSIYKEVWPYWKTDGGWINADEQEQHIRSISR